MKVILLGGFLGSGKTSVLLQLATHIANSCPNGENGIAIIENEIGKIAIDDKAIGKSGSYTVETLFSGCVCCTLAGDLVGSLKRIEDELNPAYVVIEPSGVADPSAIAGVLAQYAGVHPAIVSVVDAERWDKIRRAMEQIVGMQLAGAELVLLNKVDKVEPGVADAAEKSIREFNGAAGIRRICAAGSIPKDVLEEICSIARRK